MYACFSDARARGDERGGEMRHGDQGARMVENADAIGTNARGERGIERFVGGGERGE